MPCYEVKIVEGEIWVRGDCVMMGYYKNEAETAEVFDGEWFKTGDLGSVDSDNFLYLTGRKKNLIVLSNGENVSPEELEGILGRIEGILDVLVYEEDSLICGEFFLDNELLDENSLQEAIDHLNRSLPVYKRVEKLKIRTEEFPKTTSHKIKRY